MHWRRRGPRRSRSFSASRSARHRFPPTRRRAASGRDWRSGASGTASSSASTRSSPGWDGWEAGSHTTNCRSSRISSPTGKGLGAAYAPLAAALCQEHVYEAIAAGSRSFDLGHTWDGAPLPCAVGLAVLAVLAERGLVQRVRERGPSLRDEFAAALDGLEIVGDVRGRGFLLGVDYVDPRDGESFLPDELHADELVDRLAFEHGLLVMSTHPTPDGYAGDQTVLAPAYTSTDEELAEMIERFAAALAEVEAEVKRGLT